MSRSQYPSDFHFRAPMNNDRPLILVSLRIRRRHLWASSSCANSTPALATLLKASSDRMLVRTYQGAIIFTRLPWKKAVLLRECSTPLMAHLLAAYWGARGQSRNAAPEP